jgi:protein gp37
MSTKIQWTQETWNPVGGCRRKSPGCLNCYAERQAHRLAGNPNEKIQALYSGLTQITNGRPGWTGATSFSGSALLKPLKTRKPTTFFISLSDLFYDARSDTDIDMVFAVMALSGRHRFQVLTKYADRMQRYVTRLASSIFPLEMCARMLGYTFDYNGTPLLSWPIPNIWLGVSVEDQKHADERIPLLLRTPAALRFVSYEPALAGVNFDPIWLRPSPSTAFLDGRVKPESPLSVGCVGLDWIICGGESGPGARPCDVAWVRSAVRQCADAGVSCFVKQLGAAPIVSPCRQHHWDFGGAIGRVARFSPTDKRYPSSEPWRVHFTDRKGGAMEEWPEDLRVREMPEPAI